MGTTAGLDARGFLLVDADDGTRRTVLSGGVRQATAAPSL
jgi:BirA family biotin operon repressor/biotin-[acetyl-CoA-carboxylase] ligase